MAIFNGCLIYLSALGSNTVLNKTPATNEELSDPSHEDIFDPEDSVGITTSLRKPKRKFFTNWYS